MHLRSQRGSGALIMVMVVLLMGTLMLNATRRQLSDSLSLVSDERQYLQQLNAAMSALAWGERQRWAGDEGVQCQQQADYQWRACLLLPQLLRADSGPGTLTLYRWVSQRSAGSLMAQPHGWIDYCPLSEEQACYVE